ncbi:restriction endonuclease subunit S [Streptococcus ruminantium]|uniref:restriction endonuclease subunit S n=1 Tax=Streptococcus ruminantium TaxID=1917441 RepID=UPI0012DDC363|nr:restriction endonuclease subunit S [Streptococcus ruminantium]
MTYIDEMMKALCPDGVEWKELGEVADIKNGYAFKSSAYSEQGIRVIRISDVQKGKLSNKDVKYYPFEMEEEIASYLLHEEDLVMSLTGNVGRVAMISKDILPAGLNQRVACIRPHTSVLVRFLFHYFDQVSFEAEAIQNATGGGQKNLSTRWLSEFPIPLPPLEIQEEIVKILDKFTDYVTELTAELTAELTLRQQQYSFYRDKLLSFDEDSSGGVNNKVYTVQWKTLGEVARLKNGRDWKSLPSGEVPVYGSGGEMGEFVSDYAYDKPTVLIPRKGSISNLFYLDKPFWNVDTIYYTEIDDSQMMPRYFYHYLTTVDLERLSTNPTRPSLTQAILDKIEIPLPSLAIQSRIVQMLDNFDTVCNDLNIGLPKEIELRQKQYEFFRDKLLTFTAEGVYTDSTVQTRPN